MAKRVLIAEDEPSILASLEFLMRQGGFETRSATGGEEALSLVATFRPHLVLLDIMLPQRSGLEICRLIRAESSLAATRVLMLTAKGGNREVERGLEAGADDYVTKPFSPKELVARVRAVLRRRAPHLAGEAVEVADLQLNPATHRVLAAGLPIDLGPTEFRLLFFFMTHAERVYTRAQLLDEVWGDHVFIEERTVDVHIRRLRAALESSGHHERVETVRGTGYRFRGA